MLLPLPPHGDNVFTGAEYLQRPTHTSSPARGLQAYGYVPFRHIPAVVPYPLMWEASIALQ